jgi:hypothetical protein
MKNENPMNTYYLTWGGCDSPTDFTVYENLDEAYDTAEAYSAHAKRAVNIYENDAIMAVIRNFN